MTWRLRLIGGLLVVVIVVVIGGAIVLPATLNSGPASPSPPRPPAWLAGRHEPYALVQVGEAAVWARLAISPEERMRGLSGVERIEPDEGMLFVYAVKGRHPFWMRGMLFSIDMIWIDTDRVVDIKPDRPVPAPNQSEVDLPIYTPTADANYVLEVNAGWAAANKITVGTPVTITFPAGVAIPR
ncbi:MAG: DUF192 domain-containing protein [Chloroflexota bacterium]|nr:DUF192 domain-containing protein [Dehalococcoidia bacterium]MDW8254474.1 DUF192 domain-containing protein [Chloroflexota bacterium]